MTVAPLDGQVAVVTGASRGIGRAIAMTLAGAGARIALLARDPDSLATTARACDPTGNDVHTAAVDVTDPAAVGAAVAGVEERFGRIDLLVNSAGAIESAEGPLWEADPDDWWRVFEVNVRGVALMLRAAIPGMVQRGSGRVVNMASGMGVRPVPEYSAYSASKAALLRMTDAMTVPLSDTGVRVFDVSPGLVRTDMTDAMPIWQNHRPDQFFDVTRVAYLVLDIATGRLDALAGRFIHAGRDDVEELLRGADAIAAADARTLRLRPYGADDPMA